MTAKRDITGPDDAAELNNPTDRGPASHDRTEDSLDSVERQKLDELRRFQVMTVPPGLRKGWLLAKAPLVTPEQLQDTLPPNTDIAQEPHPLDAEFANASVETTKITRPRRWSWRPRVLIALAAAAVVSLALGIEIIVTRGESTGSRATERGPMANPGTTMARATSSPRAPVSALNTSTSASPRLRPSEAPNKRKENDPLPQRSEKESLGVQGLPQQKKPAPQQPSWHAPDERPRASGRSSASTHDSEHSPRGPGAPSEPQEPAEDDIDTPLYHR